MTPVLYVKKILDASGVKPSQISELEDKIEQSEEKIDEHLKEEEI